MDNSVKLESIDGKCKNCGNNLKFSPNDKALKCEKCGSLEHIELSVNNKKLSCSNVKDEELKEWKSVEKHIKCKSCGSQIDSTKNEISIRCPYCDSQNIILEKEVKGLYPRNIALFEFDKNEASLKFQTQIKKKFMAPRKFKKLLPENQIDGYYFPSFDFDADSVSHYKGRLYRYERVGSGKNAHTVTVRFDIKGDINVAHRDVLVESSSRLNQNDVQKILPYNYQALKDFNPRLLFGYQVEQYDEQFSTVVKKSNELFDKQIRDKILSKYNYDGVDYLDVNSSFSNQCYSYCMMPVYAFNYEYKNKSYTTLMNGQTGKIGGGWPISKLKVAFGIILFVLVILAFVLLGALGGE